LTLSAGTASVHSGLVVCDGYSYYASAQSRIAPGRVPRDRSLIDPACNAKFIILVVIVWIRPPYKGKDTNLASGYSGYTMPVIPAYFTIK